MGDFSSTRSPSRPIVSPLSAPASLPPAHLHPHSFSLALVNVAGSRLVLNIKVYAAERDAYDNLGLPLSMPASEDSLVSPKMKFWRNRDKSQDQVESKSSDRDSAFVSLGYEDDEFWM